MLAALHLPKAGWSFFKSSGFCIKRTAKANSCFPPWLLTSLSFCSLNRKAEINHVFFGPLVVFSLELIPGKIFCCYSFELTPNSLLFYMIVQFTLLLASYLITDLKAITTILSLKCLIFFRTLKNIFELKQSFLTIKCHVTVFFSLAAISKVNWTLERLCKFSFLIFYHYQDLKEELKFQENKRKDIRNVKSCLRVFCHHTGYFCLWKSSKTKTLNHYLWIKNVPHTNKIFY